MSEIKNFEDACAKLGINPLTLPDVSMFPKSEGEEYGIAECITSFYKLTVIAKALNEGWTPNWEDGNEAKYFPYFDMNPSDGSGFSFHDANFSYWAANVGFGSRLCYRTRALAKHAGTEPGIFELYKIFLK